MNGYETLTAEIMWTLSTFFERILHRKQVNLLVLTNSTSKLWPIYKDCLETNLMTLVPIALYGSVSGDCRAKPFSLP